MTPSSTLWLEKQSVHCSKSRVALAPYLIREGEGSGGNVKRHACIVTCSLVSLSHFVLINVFCFLTPVGWG